MPDNNVNITDSGELQGEYTFGDYLKVVFRYRKFLIISTLLVGLIIAFLMFFVVDPIYLSNATVKSAGGGSGLGSLLGFTPITDFGGLEELSGGSSKELALYEEILLSRRCIEETILKFNLMELYEIEYMQNAVKAFRENILVISSNRKAGTLTIGIYDTDRQRAKDIADFMIYQLNKINAEMNALNAKNNRIFIEQRYDSAKKDLSEAEDRMKEFQDKNGISPEIQAEVASKNSLELEVQIKSEEVKLELLRKVLTSNQPEIAEQEAKIDLLKKQLDIINNSEQGSGFLHLKGLPSVLINYIRLKRDLEIQNKIVTTMIPILEQAKFEEKKETPTVIVLDNPNVPELKSKPKRLTTIAVSMVVFFIFTTVVILLYELFYKRIVKLLRNA